VPEVPDPLDPPEVPDPDVPPKPPPPSPLPGVLSVDPQPYSASSADVATAMAVRPANFFMMSPLNDYWWGHCCKLHANVNYGLITRPERRYIEKTKQNENLPRRNRGFVSMANPCSARVLRNARARRNRPNRHQSPAGTVT
jgi:hypothetical protein